MGNCAPRGDASGEAKWETVRKRKNWNLDALRGNTGRVHAKSEKTNLDLNRALKRG